MKPSTLGRCLLFALSLLAEYSEAQHCVTAVVRDIFDSHRFSGRTLAIEGETIHFGNELEAFYERLGFEPVWLEEAQVNAMVNTAHASKFEGLLPSDYHDKALTALHAFRHPTDVQRAHFDVLLTDAYLTYAQHQLAGKSGPQMLIGDKWEVRTAQVNSDSLLLALLHVTDLNDALARMRPESADYQWLVSHLKAVCRQEASSVSIPPGIALGPGASDKRVELVREQLGLAVSANPLLYDSVLFHQALLFQKSRGLLPNGIIDSITLEVLNVSVQQLINTIKVNLERHRRLPHRLAPRRVEVNIPDFSLKVWQGDTVISTMGVVVGRPDRSTPVLNGIIRYVVLNPTWTVPPTILKEDVLPAIQNNVRYLERNKLKVIDRNGHEVDPLQIPWSTYNAKNFPYELRQDPGAFNAMGLIKFQFSNRYGVYLHDTNTPSLFRQHFRALSSGCVRIERPFELAAIVLKGTRWTQEKIVKEIETGKTRTITLADPMAIHLRYFTAFMQDGKLQLREDVYGMDSLLLKAIETPMR